MNGDVHRLTVARFDCQGRHFAVARCRIHGVMWNLGIEFHERPSGESVDDTEELVTLWAVGTNERLYDVIGARTGLPGSVLRVVGPRIGDDLHGPLLRRAVTR